MSPRKGRAGVRIYRRKVLDAAEKASKQPITDCAILVEREAKKIMRKGGGQLNEPSPPGQPPHVQTGALRASIATAWTGGISAITGPQEPYGRVHEYGGRHHPKRPFMWPALLNVRGRFPEQFKGLNLRRAGNR